MGDKVNGSFGKIYCDGNEIGEIKQFSITRVPTTHYFIPLLAPILRFIKRWRKEKTDEL